MRERFRREVREILHHPVNNVPGARASGSQGANGPGTSDIQGVRILTNWNRPRLARRAIFLAGGAALFIVLNLLMLQYLAAWCLLATVTAAAFTVLGVLKDQQGRASHGWATYRLQLTGSAGPVEVASSPDKAYLQALVQSGIHLRRQAERGSDPHV